MRNRFPLSAVTLLLITLAGCASADKEVEDPNCVAKIDKSIAEGKSFGNLIQGGYSEGSIAQAITARKASIKACHDELLLPTEKNEDGQVELYFLIRSDGKAGKTCIVRSDFENSIFKGCVMKRLKLVKFAAPRYGTPTAVKYTVSFK
jgi:hypothetical protein